MSTKLELKKFFEKQGLSKEVICGLLGNIQIECGFVLKSENLNYTNAERLREIWPSKFQTMSDKDIQAYIVKKDMKPKEREEANRKLADLVYKTFGGYDYRGRGYIQLTGKANYELYGKLINLDLLKNPDLLLNHEVAANVAIAYIKRNAFPQWKGDLNRCTDIKMVADTITKSIQGFRKDYTKGNLKEHLENKRAAALKFYKEYDKIS